MPTRVCFGAGLTGSTGSESSSRPYAPAPGVQITNRSPGPILTVLRGPRLTTLHRGCEPRRQFYESRTLAGTEKVGGTRSQKDSPRGRVVLLPVAVFPSPLLDPEVPSALPSLAALEAIRLVHPSLRQDRNLQRDVELHVPHDAWSLCRIDGSSQFSAATDNGKKKKVEKHGEPND